MVNTWERREGERVRTPVLLIVRCAFRLSSHKLSRLALATAANWGRRSANRRPSTFTFFSSSFLLRSINFAEASNECLQGAICLGYFLNSGANQDMSLEWRRKGIYLGICVHIMGHALMTSVQTAGGRGSPKSWKKKQHQWFSVCDKGPHLSRVGPRFDLRFQRKFQWHLTLWCKCSQKMQKLKKSTEGS